jgi:feruloyl-CoA synthase
VLSDAVITGQDRPFAGALAWLNPAEAAKLTGDGAAHRGELMVSEELAGILSLALASHNAGAGSASRIERLAVLARPPDLDAGEITDKGYINQRRVLDRRAALIELLYADPPSPGVITPSAAGR